MKVSPVMRLRHFLFVLLVPFLVSACDPVPAPFTPAQPSFSGQPPLRFSVAKMEVVEDYEAPGKYPNVDHLMAYAPDDVFRIWVNDRIKTVGNSYSMQINIVDASVKETTLPVTTGMKGYFTNEQAERYDASIAVTMKIYAEGKGLPIAEVEAHANKSRTLAEDASLSEREKLYYELTLELMQELNDTLEKNIRQYFSPYLM